MLRHFTLAALMSPSLCPVGTDCFCRGRCRAAGLAERKRSGLRQVPLTEDMVNRFIASFKDMREVAKKFPNTKLPDSVIDEAPGSELKHMPEDKRAAMTEVATANRFKDLEEWSVVGSSIAMSYTYALQGKKPGELSKAISMHISEVKEDPKLNSEQKEAQIAR